MRKGRLLLVFVSSYAVFASTSRAEEIPKTSLLSRKSWTRFDVILGRITALNPRYRQVNTVFDGSAAKGTRESLSLQVDDGVPSLNYELLSSNTRIRIEVNCGNHVIVQQNSLDDSRHITYEQPAEGRVVFEVDASGERQTYTAQNLWELILAEPTACQTHLLPLLNLMRPNWQLVKRAAQLESALVRAAKSELSLDQQKLDDLVKQLGSRRFKQRHVADRKLRASGQVILAYLDRLDESHLDGEQRRRIRNIKRDLVFSGEDTPERVAMWLIDSPSVWLILMDRPTASTRETATKHLARITDRPIEFSTDASAKERRELISQLRSELVP